MNRIAILTLAALAFAGAAGAAAPSVPSFKDPLDLAAPATALGARMQLAAVTRAGNRLVAVGIRGLVIYSDDEGKHWSQARVPVSEELVAVQFVTPEIGWAVGHGGVVLHSEDGGKTWVKQLDGRIAAKLLKAHFSAKAAAGDSRARAYLNGVDLNYQDGPEQALLGVWFEDERNGFVAGSFGTLLSTHDGGKTWESWMERVDSDDLLHLNAVRGIGGNIYLASEHGTVFRLDRNKQRFVPTSTGYGGSFFGLVGQGNTVVAYGLQGTAYRTADAGATWQRIDTGVRSTIDGGTVLSDGRIALVTQDGQILISADDGRHFRPVAVRSRSLFQDIVQVGASSVVVVVGSDGLQLAGLE
ncbi:YCF48-related protein [Paraburkholderia phymatum]|uniref:WD40/YVTN/BNR-like repeat-containing protein n=1 Tax=Paraburkholderia phymatum TaxID=148447 RepID=UPI00317ABF79